MSCFYFTAKLERPTNSTQQHEEPGESEAAPDSADLSVLYCTINKQGRQVQYGGQSWSHNPVFAFANHIVCVCLQQWLFAK